MNTKKAIKLLISLYHWKLGLLGALIYRFPSRKLIVVGVTGTKGKTTTLALLSDILERAGHKTALISSTTLKIGDKLEKNRTGNSMPGRFFLQKFLSEAVIAGCDIALIEVTSQGVVQHRHKFIFWDRAVFLNIHPEHIESHGSFENYLKAKLSFFEYVNRHRDLKEPQFFVWQEDDRSADFLKTVGNLPVIKFMANDADLIKAKIPKTLAPNFMKPNISAAIAVARSLNVPTEYIKEAIENFSGVEGRMDVVIKKPFTAIVDYAHTPDSLESVYKYLTENKNKSGKLICVLGSAGGGRDKWKRPAMGKIAAQYCDKIVLTDEDPYEENPVSIIKDVEDGFLQAPGRKLKVEGKEYWKIVDRKEAIKKAISLAKAGDIVICTGKGSEESIHIASGQKIPWSEKKAILEAVSKN